MSHDPRVERERIASALAEVDRIGDCGSSGSAALLVTTTTLTTYPTVASAFYAANPTSLDGDEVEGATATPTADATATLFVWNSGTAVPPVDTLVVAENVGGRWVFRWDG